MKMSSFNFSNVFLAKISSAMIVIMMVYNVVCAYDYYSFNPGPTIIKSITTIRHDTGELKIFDYEDNITIFIGRGDIMAIKYTVARYRNAVLETDRMIVDSDNNEIHVGGLVRQVRAENILYSYQLEVPKYVSKGCGHYINVGYYTLPLNYISYFSPIRVNISKFDVCIID